MTGRWWRGTCLLVLLASAAVIGSKAWVRRQHDAAFAAHELKRKELQQRHDLKVRQYVLPVRARIDALRAKAATFDEYVHEFRDMSAVATVGVNSGTPYRSLKFTEPVSGSTFDLLFLDGSFVTVINTSEVRPSLTFDPSPWDGYGKMVGHAGTAAVAIWVVGFTLAFSLPRHRRAIAFMLFSIAVFAAAAGSLDAAPGVLFRPELRVRAFCGPVFLIAASAVLVAWPARQTPVGRHCRVCGYDLTGNVSGRCPECGTYDRLNPATSEEIASRLAGAEGIGKSED
jgi:hypothetical protein